MDCRVSSDDPTSLPAEAWVREHPHGSLAASKDFDDHSVRNRLHRAPYTATGASALGGPESWIRSFSGGAGRQTLGSLLPYGFGGELHANDFF